MVIIYLSSGLTSRESSEQEKRATLSVVREENRHLNNSVMILTYALMNGRVAVTQVVLGWDQVVNGAQMTTEVIVFVLKVSADQVVDWFCECGDCDWSLATTAVSGVSPHSSSSSLCVNPLPCVHGH